MKKSIMKITTITISLITALLLTSCNTNSNTNSNSNSNDEPMETGHIETIIENNQGEIVANINANIIGSDSQSLPVATVQRHDIDSDNAEDMATAIFDNSEFYNKRSVEEYSIEELNTLISKQESLKDIICTSDKTSPNEGQVITGIANYSIYNKDLDYYYSLKSSANTDPVLTSNIEYVYNPISSMGYPVDNFSVEDCSLVGTYNNLPCTMLFQKYEISESLNSNEYNSTNLTISIDAGEQPAWGEYNLNQLSYYNVSNTPSSFYNISEEADNRCKYTIDDAVLLCDNMVKQLGITDMTASRYANLVTVAYELPLSDYYTLNTVKESGNCGYRIYYEKTINGTHNYTPIGHAFEPLLNTNRNSSNLFDYTFLYGYECLIFTVFDCGIVAVEYGNPLEIVDINSDNTPLLDFDDIMSIADIGFNETYGNNTYNTTINGCINIDKIELTLMRIISNESDDTYTLIPVWIFIEKESSEIKLRLNAIDGSIVEYDSMY